MRNQEIAKGLRLIAEGFQFLAVAYEKEPVITGVDMSSEGDKTVVSVVNPKTKEVVKQEVQEPVKEVKEEPKKEAQPTPVNTFPTEEELNALSYNDLKAKAKELGVKAVGSKKAIIENILASTGNIDAPKHEEVEEALENTTELPSEDRGEEVLVNEDEEALADDEETLYDQVTRDLEGYSDEELANILSEVGISPKGRRQALLAKIVQAIEDGKLEWEDDSEEQETPQGTTGESSKNNVSEDIEEEDFVGTEARKHACWEECDAIELAVDKGELSHKEILKYLKDYHNGKYVSQGKEADIEEYLAIQCDLIDDEGQKHDLADPYYIGDDIFCCGQHLKELNDDLYCEICGTQYLK